MGFLEQAVTSLANSILLAGGEEVTYARGASSATLTMARGSTEFEGFDAGDQEFTGKTVDWLIEPDDLTLASPVGNTLPAVGDTITDSDSQVYTVVTPGGERCYRYTDQTRKFLRVHTVRTT
jgi:hypothetical protein